MVDVLSLVVVYDEPLVLDADPGPDAVVADELDELLAGDDCSERQVEVDDVRRGDGLASVAAPELDDESPARVPELAGSDTWLPADGPLAAAGAPPGGGVPSEVANVDDRC